MRFTSCCIWKIPIRACISPRLARSFLGGKPTLCAATHRYSPLSAAASPIWPVQPFFPVTALPSPPDLPLPSTPSQLALRHTDFISGSGRFRFASAYSTPLSPYPSCRPFVAVIVASQQSQGAWQSRAKFNLRNVTIFKDSIPTSSVFPLI